MRPFTMPMREYPDDASTGVITRSTPVPPCDARVEYVPSSNMAFLHPKHDA